SPCQMCSGAILLFQIPRVVVGEATTFAGDLAFLTSNGVEVVLVDDARCTGVMHEFQERYPGVWSEDIGGRYRSGWAPASGSTGRAWPGRYTGTRRRSRSSPARTTRSRSAGERRCGPSDLLAASQISCPFRPPPRPAMGDPA